MRQKDILRILDLYMRREQKVAISLIIIYCSTTHATFFFIFLQPKNFALTSVFYVHITGQIGQYTHTRSTNSLFYFFQLEFICLPMIFLFFYEFRLSIELQQCNNTTIYGYFSPYFQGHCSPIANSFFHAYQNETKLA